MKQVPKMIDSVRHIWYHIFRAKESILLDIDIFEVTHIAPDFKTEP